MRTSSLTPAQAIDRYFEVCLFLMLGTGFATLAGTGKLDPFSVLLVAVALLVRGSLFISGRNLLIPERWTTAFTLLYILFYAADYLLLSRGFVPATVHLVLFNVVVKVFSVHRERDNVYLALLSFLMVLAAAVLTIDTLFLTSFSLFVLLAIATFTSMEIRRSIKASGESSGSGRARFAGALSRTTVTLLVGIAVCSVFMFFLLPRATGGYLGRMLTKDALSTGFSDEVALGAIGTIQQSNDVVMHVQFAAGSKSPLSTDMRWRGMSLALFDGRRWSNRNSKVTILPNAPGRGFTLPPAVSSSQGEKYSYRVIMEPTSTNIFFVLPRATSLSGDYKLVGVNFGEAIENLERERPIGTYTANSVAPAQPPDTAEGAVETAKYPPDIALAYLQVPKLDARIPRLARQITSGASGNYKKAQAMERYLQENYGYTLQLSDPGSEDPLSYFLFTRRQGHCEYFASSMAIMLRSQGIPARIVNGFRGGEWNDINGAYIVRQRDAHSWVEAYLPPYGWVTFDPTPAGPGDPINRWARVLLYMDALRVFWREWIINFDFSRQNNLSHQIGAETRSFSQRLSAWFHHKQLLFHNRLHHVQMEMVHSPLSWTLRLLGVLLAFSLLLIIPRLYRSARTVGLMRRPAASPRHASTLWYRKMLKRLARGGYVKKQTETAGEFASTIQPAKLQTTVRTFSEHYERARFADSKEDVERLEELFHEIETTLKK